MGWQDDHNYCEGEELRLQSRPERFQWTRETGDKESWDVELDLVWNGEESAKKHRRWHLEVDRVKGEVNPTRCMTRRVGERPDSCS